MPKKLQKKITPKNQSRIFWLQQWIIITTLQKILRKMHMIFQIKKEWLQSEKKQITLQALKWVLIRRICHLPRTIQDNPSKLFLAQIVCGMVVTLNNT